MHVESNKSIKEDRPYVKKKQKNLLRFCIGGGLRSAHGSGESPSWAYSRSEPRTIDIISYRIGSVGVSTAAM